MSTPPSFPGVLPAAFAELRAVVEAHGPLAWPRLLDALSPEAREAATDPTGIAFDATWVEAVDVADAQLGGGGTLARTVGSVRADARLRELRGRYEGDPLAFLRADAACFYRDRATYGAASVELAPRRATLRVVASRFWLRRADGRPSVAPRVALGFFDRAIELLGGGPLRGRYAGHARRADSLGGVELFNLLFEYPLEEE